LKYLLYYESEDADPDLESLPFDFSHVPSCVSILFDLPLSQIIHKPGAGKGLAYIVRYPEKVRKPGRADAPKHLRRLISC